MGVDYVARLMWGVTVYEARDAMGRTLEERWRAGEWATNAEFIEELFHGGETAPGGLMVTHAESASARSPGGRPPVVGVQVFRMWNRDQFDLVDGPVDVSVLERVREKTVQAFAAVGVRVTPRLLLVGKVD